MNIFILYNNIYFAKRNVIEYKLLKSGLQCSSIIDYSRLYRNCNKPMGNIASTQGRCWLRIRCIYMDTFRLHINNTNNYHGGSIPLFSHHLPILRYQPIYQMLEIPRSILLRIYIYSWVHTRMDTWDVLDRMKKEMNPVIILIKLLKKNIPMYV